VPVVRSCSGQYRYTGCCADSGWFPESFLTHPTGSGYGCRVCLRCLADVFRYAGQGRRRRSRNAGCGLFVRCVLRSGGARRAQAVLGVVVVVLGSADGLFGLGSAMLVVAVAVSSEMQQLVTADDILIAWV
jgi:hypothetical protein